MSRYIGAARAVSGVLSVIALLALVVGEFWYNGQVRARTIMVLLVLIGALLGVDLLGEILPVTVSFEAFGQYVPLTLTVEREDEENGESDTNRDNDT